MAKKNEQQLAAQQAAQRAKEEAARKAAIRQQISIRDGKIVQLSGIIYELQTERAELGNTIQKWETAKQAFMQSDITRMGQIKNVFEGDAAQSVKQQNDSKILTMNGKVASAAAIKNSISVQENRVRTQINILNTEIANLRSQL